MFDTSPKVTRRYYELLRQKTGVERLAITAALTRSVRRLAEAGIRSERPELTDRQVQARLAERMYGTDVAQRLFGRDLLP